MLGEGAVLRLHDQVLAVDEGAIDIEDDQLEHGRSAPSAHGLRAPPSVDAASPTPPVTANRTAAGCPAAPADASSYAVAPPVPPEAGQGPQRGAVLGFVLVTAPAVVLGAAPAPHRRAAPHQPAQRPRATRTNPRTAPRCGPCPASGGTGGATARSGPEQTGQRDGQQGDGPHAILNLVVPARGRERLWTVSRCVDENTARCFYRNRVQARKPVAAARIDGLRPIEAPRGVLVHAATDEARVMATGSCSKALLVFVKSACTCWPAAS
jgi:hypothetical protein